MQSNHELKEKLADASFDQKRYWLSNCCLALKLWQERVKADQVFPNLRRWRCGTQACFGGWVATWPEFQALGVDTYETDDPGSNRSGKPYMVDGSFFLTDYGLSQHLFGHRDMFCPSVEEDMDAMDPDLFEIKPVGMHDYNVVLFRLETQILNLQEAGAVCG
ncbi:hypothetical protein Lumi_109 [Xylophilus phage Lumi]|nr:hypothetical protein Lumi_109 [Xylophilus phage Lumi]